jgi:hypothetical protein
MKNAWLSSRGKRVADSDMKKAFAAVVIWVTEKGALLVSMTVGLKCEKPLPLTSTGYSTHGKKQT